MPRSLFQPRETTRLADSLSFDTRASNDIWKLGTDHAWDDDISGLSSLYDQPAPVTGAPGLLEMPEPLPVVVSERPDAGQIRERQQPAAATVAPAAMPTAPAQPEVTITDGRTEPQPSMQPGESVGDVSITQGARSPYPSVTAASARGGSNPEKQAVAYQEALASGLDQEGAQILVAVTETEGGLTGDIGDQGQSRGGYQFHEGGQMPGFRAWLRQQGIQGDPNDLVHDIRLTTRYAATGYLGRAIAAGRAAGLRGAELATYVQTHGQVSVDPWKTGQNYERLYGGGQTPAPPNAGVQSAPAASSPSGTPAGASPSAPAGASPQVTLRHKRTGLESKVSRDSLEFMTNLGEFDIIDGAPVASASPLDAARSENQGGQGDMQRGPLSQQPELPEGQASPDSVAESFAPGDGAVPPTPDPQYGPPLSEAGPETSPQGTVRGTESVPFEVPFQIGDISITNGGPAPENAQYTEMPTRAPQYGPSLSEAGPDQSGIRNISQAIEGPGKRLYEAATPSNVIDTLGAAAGAAGQAIKDEAFPTPEQQTANAGKLPMQRGIELVQAAMDVGNTEIGRRIGRAAGLTDDELFTIWGIPVSGEDIAGFAGTALLDPTNLIGAGPVARGAQMAVQAAPDAARAVSRGATQVGRELAETAAGMALDATPNPRMAGSSWDDISRQINRPQEPVPKPPRPENEQLIREQYGRPWEEVAPTGPSAVSRLGEATDQMVTEGRNLGGPRNRLTENDALDLTPPVKIDQNMQGRQNATPGVAPTAGAGALAQINADIGSSIGSSTFGAAAGAALPADTDEERAQNALRGAGVGLVAGPAASRLLRRGGGAQATFGFGGRPATEAASAAPNPTMQQMARQMAGQYTPSTVTNRRGLLERWAQAMTDDRAGIRNFQEAVSRSIGRPLTAGESVAELTRVNPASVASQRLDDEVRAAWQAVGDDEDYLAQYVVHMHNVDVAREMGQRAYDAAIAAGSSPQMASRRAMAATNARQFSGDLRLGETVQQLQDIEQRVLSLPEGAERWQAIKDAAQATWDGGRKTLERKRDAGFLDAQFFTDLTAKYPHYVRTDIADYFDKGTGGPAPAGKRIGVSDIGIQKISPQGTTKDRVNPLLSFIDQTYSAEAAIARNEAGKAFEELLRLDPAWQSTFKEVVPAQGVNVGNPATTVPASYTLKNDEQFLRVWDGGQARTYVVPPEYAALVAPKTGRILGDNGGARLLQGAMNVYKSLITSKNPAFAMIVSPLRDIGDYAIREGTLSAKDGGIRGMAQGAAGAVGAMADYARAVPDAFAGILEGTYKGDLARMMREGAGQISRPGREQKDLRNALRDLQRTNGLEVTSAGDALRLAGKVLTLGAEPIGNRIEQIPRLAASRRAARRGASDLGQAMAFRDATVDFQRAGEWSRVINSVVPFFNVAMQGGAQVVRTYQANPAAFIGAVATTVGTAALAAEAWNNADEQRASDYEDVPDYLKKTGIVIMLPGVAGTSERGDPLPNYAWIPVGTYGALVQTAKETAKNYVAGKQGADLTTLSGWGQLGAEVAGIFSPIKGDSAGGVVSSLMPPGASTAAELAANKDLFRGSTIATDRRDESASAISQGSAALANAATGKETRASQWEYLYRDLGGYGATLALEGSNLLAEKLGMRTPKQEDRPIQNAPVVGGLVNRVVRDAGGQRLQDVTEEGTRVPESIRETLQEVGLRREQVTPVASEYKGARLTRDEQQRWQELTNSLAEREISTVRRSAEWRARGADRAQLVQDALSRAKTQAAQRALRRLTDAEIERRIRRAS